VTADAVLRALAAACPASREASAGDAVAGVAPRYAAAPATVAEASALLRAAAEHDLTVVPRGSGSKLGWGAPPRRCDLVVDTAALDQVLEHAAGDLVARVQAGVSMQRLGEILAGAGQELALDAPPGLGGAAGPAPSGAVPDGTASGTGPPGAGLDGAGPDGAGLDGAGLNGGWPAGGTVGGTLATAAAGPRRLRYGTPRDLVIGLTVVRADGTVAHSGGKVVKNVAGYDLGKLFAGSFGTLGLIVEAVFRLHPRPSATAYVTLDCPDAAAAYRAVAAASASVLAPSAIEIDRPARDRAIAVGVLLEGGPAGAGERATLMRDLLAAQQGDEAPPAARDPGPAVHSSPPAWWGWHAGEPTETGGTAALPRPGGTLVRVAFWAGALPRVLGVIDAAARAAGLDPPVGGSAAAGVIYAAAGPGADPAAVAAFVSALRAAFAHGEGDPGASGTAPAKGEGETAKGKGEGGTGRRAEGGSPVLASAVIVQAPPAVRDLVDLWGPVPSLPLMRAVKDQFDPGHRMAPGRFAGGI
jgi:glycolate oxidase FAD binding subunit